MFKPSEQKKNMWKITSADTRDVFVSFTTKEFSRAINLVKKATFFNLVQLY